MKNIFKYKNIIGMLIFLFIFIPFLYRGLTVYAVPPGDNSGGGAIDTGHYNGPDGNGGYNLNGHHYSYVKYKTVTSNVTDSTEDMWSKVYSEIDSSWQAINTSADRGYSYPYKVQDGWTDPDAYYKLPNNGLEVRTVKHPIIRAFIKRTYVNYNYKNSYKTLHFNWTISGPGAVSVRGIGSGKTNWTTPANNNSCIIEYFDPGLYTITSTPYEQWNINTRYEYTATMYQGSTEIGVREHYITKYSKTTSGEIVSDRKIWHENITTSDLEEWLPVQNTKTTYYGDAQVKIIQ